MSTTHAVRVHAPGGPEVLRWEAVEVGAPGPGEALVRHTAVGLNFIDVYFRTGLYPPPAHPFTPGNEGVGVVEAVGSDVREVAVGDRVGYAGPLGSYSEARLVPADRLVRLPAEVTDELAAASLLKGMTACYLLRRTFRVEARHTILVHAAAGGVGSLLCQWANRLGATVIGTVGSEEKAASARRDGCHHTILYKQEPVAPRVRELTAGRGVDVVYDSVGKDTIQGSLDSLAALGMLVSFGQSSGPPPPLALSELASRGSLFLTRPSLMDYTAAREDLVEIAAELFEVLADGTVQVHVGARFPLSEAARAHEALESRATSGSTLLMP